MIDTHCHLHYDYAPKTVETLIGDALEAGVTQLVTVGVDLETLDKVAGLNARLDGVYHSVGMHPHDGKLLDQEGVARLRHASQHPKCLAIGEIGLDYYYAHSDRESQLRALTLQLELAREVRLPIIVHSRDGEEDLLPLLQDHARGLSGSPGAAGVIHCFTGTLPFARACIEAGYFVSFSGILTFKNSEALRLLARSLPLDRLMVETDAPYLAPVPHRGKKCEPAMVVQTAQVLARLFETTLSEIDAITTANAVRVFGPRLIETQLHASSHPSTEKPQ